MFPDSTADQLFELTDDSDPQSQVLARAGEGSGLAADILTSIATNLVTQQDADLVEWGPPVLGKARSLTRSPALALRAVRPDTDRAESAGDTIGRRLLRLGQVLRLSDEGVQQLAALAGQVVDLSLRIDIDIATDGTADLNYYYHILNLSARPFTRLPREIWFQYSDGQLEITPLQDGDHRVVIKRIHDTGNLAKFACLVSPAVAAGETTQIGYRCTGGIFKEALYWRQEIPRFTRQCTLSVRHREAGTLAECIAMEEHPDGGENTAQAGLTWDYGIVIK